MNFRKVSLLVGKVFRKEPWKTGRRSTWALDYNRPWAWPEGGPARSLQALTSCRDRCKWPGKKWYRPRRWPEPGAPIENAERRLKQGDGRAGGVAGILDGGYRTLAAEGGGSSVWASRCPSASELPLGGGET